MTFAFDITDPIFHDEAKATAHMEAERWPDGVYCPLCGCDNVHKMGGKTQNGMFVCYGCAQKFTVRTGTVFERSHIPLHKWLLATRIMAASKKSVSALQLQRMLGLGSYRTAWMLCAKLRRAMVNPEREPLSGVVEADETLIPFRTQADPIVLPAGRSGVGKMLVAGAVEVDGGTPRRARLKVIEGFGKDEIHAFVLGIVAPNTRLVTDDWPSYNDIPDIKHKAITIGPMAAHIVLPWAHRLFSNLKRWGLGVYHGLRRANLQHYLDEFVFRFNRRRTRHAAFDTLLGIGARTAPAPYHVLIRKTA